MNMENRRAQRQDSKLSAEVYTGSEEIIGGGAENLCDDGVCLNLGAELPAGSLVGVSMYPMDDGIIDPDAEPVNVPAKVVWCEQKPGSLILAGMRFVDPQNL